MNLLMKFFMLSDLYCLHKSGIAGEGIFATQDIPKGKIVVIMKGKLYREVQKTKTEAMTNPNMVGISKDLWMDPVFPIVKMNHSCKPNLGMRGKVLFVAMRNIKAGEELTFDYSISEESPWEIKCYCGAPQCRRIIRSIHYLPLKTFKRYLPFIPKYFQKVYQRSVVVEK